MNAPRSPSWSSDEDRGRGLGSLLLEHLAALCREHGVTRFEAEVLADNYGMLGVFRAAGFAVTRRNQDGEVSVELRTEVSPAAIDAADRREWRSEARSLRPLLYPESVAVVGVRRTAGGLGTGRPRRDPFGGLRRSAVRRATRGRLRGRPADIPQPGRDRGDRRPRGRRGAGRPGRLEPWPTPPRRAWVRRSSCRPASPALTGGAAARRDLLRTARAHSVRVVGPTRRACCRRGRRCASTPPSRGPCRVRAGWRSPRSRAASGSPCSTWPATWASGCARSSPSAPSSTSPATTCWRPGWTTTRSLRAALYLESFGNALKFARTARRFAERKPLLGGRRRSSAARRSASTPFSPRPA